MAIDLKYIRILLVEDSKKSADLFDKMLQKMKVSKLKLAHSYVEAIRLFENHLFDLLLVDIDLGKNRRQGDDFARFVRQKHFSTPLIYLTSHYNEDTYESVKDTHPHGFLNKDVSLLELRQSIELALNNTNMVQRKNSQPKEHRLQIKSNKFFVKIGNTYKAIPIGQISYFFAKDKSTYAHFKGRSYPISVLLKDLEEQLYALGFARVHKTYLINLDKVELIDLNNNQLNVDNNTIPIGYVYRKKMLGRLNLLR